MSVGLSKMERPRRSIRPPGSLTDFLTNGDTERRPTAVGTALLGDRDIEEGKQDPQQQQQQQQKNNNSNNNKEHDDCKRDGQGEMDDKFLLSQPYKCRECKARYRSRVALLRHAGKHSGQFTYFFVLYVCHCI